MRKTCWSVTDVPGGASAKRNSTNVAVSLRRIAPGSSRNGHACRPEHSHGRVCDQHRMSDNRANAEVRILQNAAAIAKRAAEEFIKSANAAAKSNEIGRASCRER